MNPAADDSLTALIALSGFVLGVALYVWTAIALSAMFRKMGDEPWKAWVPLFNIATLLRWGGFSPWWVLLVLFPPAAIIVWILMIVAAHRLNPGFGYGGGMAVLAALVFVVWASILGFGPARWLGARSAAWSPSTTEPRPRAQPSAALFAEPAAVVGTSIVPDAAEPPTAAAAASTAAVPDSAFAPPAAGPSSWMPPDTTPRPAPTASAGAGAAGVARAGAEPVAGGPDAGEPEADIEAVAEPVWSSATPLTAAEGPVAARRRASAPAEAADGAFGAASDEEWPSEVDDVSAVHPSPFPPSSAAGGRYVAPTVSDTDGPIAFVPGRRAAAEPVRTETPVNRVPARGRVDGFGRVGVSRARVADHGAARIPVAAPRPAAAVPRPAAAEPAAPFPEGSAPVSPLEPQRLRARRSWEGADPDAFPEMSGEVSAVIGSPAAGAPRSAAAAVSAQHRDVEEGATGPDDDMDETIIARRVVRAAWELVPASGSPIPLTSSVVILGRRPAADAAFGSAQLVAVDDDARTVSKTHARIELRDGAWVITDLASTNGVLVRTLMGEEVEVEPGAQIDAGERFFLGDAEFHLRRLTP